MEAKRVWLIAAAVLFVVPMLWAGGQSEAPPAGAAKPVAIRVQDWRFAEVPAGRLMEERLKAYTAANPHVTIKPEPVPASDREKQFVIQSQGGDPPDIVRVLTSTVSSFADMKLLYDVGALAKSSFPGNYDAAWAAHLLEACRYKGVLYGMPSEGDVYVLYIHDELYRNAGITSDPKTPADWLQHMQKVTNPGKQVYGTILRGAPDVGTSLSLQAFWLANGTDYYDDKYTQVTIDSPKGVEAFKYFVELYTKHKVVAPESIEVKYVEYFSAFSQGRVATMLLHGIGQGSMEGRFPGISEKMHTVAFPGNVRSAVGRGTLYSISAQSKNPEIAWDILKHMNEREFLVKMFLETKSYPALLEALGDQRIVSDPFARVQFDEAAYSKPYPLHPSWPKIGDMISQAVQSAFLGLKTPEAAIKEAADSARKHFAEFK